MRSRLNLECLGILLLLIGLVSLGSWTESKPGAVQVNRLDAVVFDGLQTYATIPAAAQLVYVEIDDSSITTVGPWPWSRAIYAKLVERLAAAGVKRIALDLLLPDPGRNDQALVDALAALGKQGMPLILPVGRFELGAAADSVSDGPKQSTHFLPHGLFQRDATLAHAQFRIDPDGVVRGINLFEADYPAFSLALFSMDTEVQRQVSRPGTSVWLPALHGRISTFSAKDLLAEPLNEHAWRGKTVIIGVSAAGLGDRFAHRLLGEHRIGPGAELHLASFSAIEQRRLIRELPVAVSLGVGCVILVLQMFLIVRTSAWGGLAWTAGLLFLSLLFCWWGLTHSWWWAPSATLAGLLLSYPLVSWRRLAMVTRSLQSDAQMLRESMQRSAVGLLPAAAQQVGAQRSLLSDRPVLDPLLRDLGALEQAATSTVNLQNFLAHLIQTLPNPALLARSSGTVVIANAAWRKAFGNAPESLKDLQPASLALAAGRDGSSFEYTDTQGRQWWLSLTQTSEPELKLEVYQWVDISALSKAQREREQVLRFLSHDMRAPLVSMLAQIEDQQRTFRSGRIDPPEIILQRLASLEQQTRQSLDLADSFLQLTRAEVLPPSDEPVSLNFVMQQAMDACWERAQPKKLRLRADDQLEKQEREAWIGGDAQLMRRALTNLIDNAIRYSPPDSPVDVVLIEDEPASASSVAWYRLSVRDYGAGVMPEHLPKLFDPFWRAPGQNEYGGVGLGLAFVQRVARHHGGRVTAEPKTPGVEFVLHLPALDAVKLQSSI